MTSMDLLEETVRFIQSKMDGRANPLAIEALRVGIFFTGVKLNSGHAGVAFTPAGEIPEAVCCPKSAARMPDAGKLTGKTVDDVLGYASSPNVLKRAIGIAMVNALSHFLFEEGIEQDYEVHYGPDGLDFLDVTPDDRICLVGAFTPYIRRFKGQRGRFVILERTPDALRPDEMKYFRPTADASKVLPDSNVIVITGAAIVNNTLDGLLEQTRPEARVAVIGPTSSMVPDVYFSRGVDLMAGIRMTNPDLMLRIVEEGGSGYHLFNTCAERVTFVKRKLN